MAYSCLSEIERTWLKATSLLAPNSAVPAMAGIACQKKYSPESQPSLVQPVVGDTPFPTVQAASGASQHAVIGAVFQSAACSHGDADQGLFGDGDGQAGRVG